MAPSAPLLVLLLTLLCGASAFIPSPSGYESICYVSSPGGPKAGFLALADAGIFRSIGLYGSIQSALDNCEREMVGDPSRNRLVIVLENGTYTETLYKPSDVDSIELLSSHFLLHNRESHLYLSPSVHIVGAGHKFNYENCTGSVSFTAWGIHFDGANAGAAFFSEPLLSYQTNIDLCVFSGFGLEREVGVLEITGTCTRRYLPPPDGCDRTHHAYNVLNNVAIATVLGATQSCYDLTRAPVLIVSRNRFENCNSTLISVDATHTCFEECVAFWNNERH